MISRLLEMRAVTWAVICLFALVTATVATPYFGHTGGVRGGSYPGFYSGGYGYGTGFGLSRGTGGRSTGGGIFRVLFSVFAFIFLMQIIFTNNAITAG